MRHHLLAAAGAALLCATGGAPAHAQHGSGSNIVETAVATDALSTLVAAVEAAGLVETLSGDGPFTVFAPTNDAFAALPHGTLDALLKPENREQLVSILTYHVAGEALDGRAVASRAGVATLNGARADVALEEGTLLVGGAAVVQANVRCSNGIVHVIDRVILPPDQNIVELAAGAGSFNTLIAAAKAAGLAGVLSDGGPFTVFAPTDEAFAALPDGVLADLLRPENKQRLAAILKYHVVEGRVFADVAASVGTAPTLQGESVRVGIRGGRLTVDGANVVSNDLQATNGVVHVIDSVLLPAELPAPRPAGRLVVGIYTADVSAALAAQLGIDAHQAFMVEELVDGGNAEAAGLRPYDVVVAIDGRPASSGELDRAKERAGFGNPLSLTLFRRGEKIAVDVTVGVERH